MHLAGANVPSVGNFILGQEPKEWTLVSLLQLLLLEVLLQVLSHLPLVLQRHSPSHWPLQHCRRGCGLSWLRLRRRWCRLRRRGWRSRLHGRRRLRQGGRSGQSRRLGWHRWRWRQRRRRRSPDGALRLGAPDHGEGPACAVRGRDRDGGPHLHLDGRDGRGQRHCCSS